MRHHGEGLLREIGDAELVDAIKTDHTAAGVTPAERAMLDYVDVLTRTPAATTEAHVTAMRDQGFSDEAILEVNQITGFFAWCNRTIDGLGVELEDFWDDPEATNI